ncbi:hypothetical protein NJ7G_3951 [Natrinema sp. J7-2]|nr:hypothetical protein NJ7G_3951 [Natrinema sp. J7-2]
MFHSRRRAIADAAVTASVSPERNRLEPHPSSGSVSSGEF